MYNIIENEYIISSTDEIVELDDSIIIEDISEIEYIESEVLEVNLLEDEKLLLEAEETIITIGTKELSELSTNAILFLENHFKDISTVSFESDNW